MKKILIIGGTGIIGKATITEAVKDGIIVYTIGLNREDTLPAGVHQIVVDKEQSQQYQAVARELNRGNEWDMVFDVYNLGKNDAEETYWNFREHTKHFVVVSTTLVYDRSTPNIEPIKSSCPLAKIGTMGGYVDHKLGLEDFWKSVKDVPWTILRPYHIVGAYSLLGCLPDENRDPKLLEKIKNGVTLELCAGGEVGFNYIHPRDIARIALCVAGNIKTFGKAYNAVNPSVIRARDYFLEIGRVLNREVQIENKSVKKIWDECRGWELTTLPHVYDISDLQKDIFFTPSIPLEQAIKEAIEYYPIGHQKLREIAVHKRMTMWPRPKRIAWLNEYGY